MKIWNVTINMQVCTPDDGTADDAITTANAYIGTLKVNGVNIVGAAPLQSDQPNHGGSNEHGH